MRFLALFFVLVLALFTAGCGGSKNPSSATDPVGAAAEASAGDEAMAAGNYASANEHYRAALALDPNNAQANIGAAVTEVYLLGSDSEVDSLRILWSANPPFPVHSPNLESTNRRARILSGIGVGIGGDGFRPFTPAAAVAKLSTLGTEDPALFSDVQRVIVLKILPRLEYVESRLMVVEANPGWRYLVPPSVTDAPDTVEIDLGEVYMLDAVVNAVQGWLGLAVAYNLDTPNGGANPESLFANGTAFGTLHTGGALALANARLNWQLAKIRLDSGIAYINAETDDQSNDVIPKEALTDPGFTSWYTDFNKLQTSLSSPVEVSVNDYQNQPMSLQIEIGRFFTNPITDIKTVLPAHTFDDAHQPVVTDPVTFPDPTFHLIFPNMTNILWRQLIGPVNPPVALARR